MLLGQAVQLFLGEYKASTQQAYRHALDPLRDRLGSQRELTEIKPEHVIAFFQAHVAAHAFAPATVSKLARTIKIFFNWCIKLEMIERSPARMLKAPRPEPDLTRDKAMSDDELAVLLAHLRVKSIPRDFALVLFLADSGCRRGGAAGLRLRDIYWDRLLADVTEKGDKTRKVAFSDECARAIRHWLMYRSDHYRLKGDYIFSRDGAAINPELLSQAIRRACKQLGLRSLGSHALRHRKGFQLNDHRVPLTVSATALGNTPEVMRDYYSPRDWETAEKALRELMTGSAPPPPPAPNVLRFPSPRK